MPTEQNALANLAGAMSILGTAITEALSATTGPDGYTCAFPKRLFVDCCALRHQLLHRPGWVEVMNVTFTPDPEDPEMSVVIRCKWVGAPSAKQLDVSGLKT